MALFSALFSALLAAAGCGDNAPRVVVDKTWRLSAETSAVAVKSGGVVPLHFTLAAKTGEAIAGQRIEFAALREADVTGATLSAPSALTDEHGVATVNLMAGRPTMFEISAQNPRAEPSRVTITVFEAPTAILSVFPDLDAGFTPALPVVSADLSLYPEQLCSSFSLARPPTSASRTVTQVPLGRATDVRIDRMQQTALLGQGRDAQGAVQAVGCVDVPSTTILQAVNGQMTLPMFAVPLSPAASYDLTARFSLAKGNLATRIAAPWQDLTDCPLDPAQVWLDCTLDALTAPAGKSLDCVPSVATPASDGTGTAAAVLAAAVGGRRGPLPTGSLCRPATLADGSPSVDALLAALFPKPAASSSSPPPKSDLDAIIGFAAHIVDDFSVKSTLQLVATGAPGTFHGTHTLRTATFALADSLVVAMADVLSLGVPESQARFVEITTLGSELAVAEHHLALRLGTLSRMAFEQAAGARLSLPAGIDYILGGLFGAASTGADPFRKTGCDALDAVMCAGAGAAAGCAVDACLVGEKALGARLASGFESANGDDADLQLSGSVDMVDTDGDGIAESLGPGPPGKWLAQFRSAGPTEAVSGQLSAVQTP